MFWPAWTEKIHKKVVTVWWSHLHDCQLDCCVENNILFDHLFIYLFIYLLVFVMHSAVWIRKQDWDSKAWQREIEAAGLSTCGKLRRPSLINFNNKMNQYWFLGLWLWCFLGIRLKATPQRRPSLVNLILRRQTVRCCGGDNFPQL